MQQTLNLRDRDELIAPLYQFDRKFWTTIAIIIVIIAPGMALYVRQLALGLGVTDLNRPVFWGAYLVNFIFLIGISMAGTVISAALTLLKVNWRRPITRIAESLTVFGLMTAGLQIIMDMGRPDRLAYTLIYGRLQAPLTMGYRLAHALFVDSDLRALLATHPRYCFAARYCARDRS